MKTVTDPRTGITLGLPNSWRLAHTGLSAYCDPEAPQYNLLVSFERLPVDWLKDGSLATHARQLCAANPLAREVEVHDSSGPRVLASYRSGGVENGQRKDDHHWLVLERGESALLVALLTLSVLADQADPEETALQARLLGGEITRLEFPEEGWPRLPGPSASLQDKVDLLEDVTLSLCQGLCQALDGAPIDKQGLVAASLGIGLYWLARLKAPFEDDLKEEIGEALSQQVIAGYCASLGADIRKLFEELGPAMRKQSQAMREHLAELFRDSELLSGESLERSIVSFGLKLLLQTTTLFRDAPLEAEALTAQAERIENLGRVVMAAPALIHEALCPEDLDPTEPGEPGPGVLANALGAPLM